MGGDWLRGHERTFLEPCKSSVSWFGDTVYTQYLLDCTLQCCAFWCHSAIKQKQTKLLWGLSSCKELRILHMVHRAYWFSPLSTRPSLLFPTLLPGAFLVWHARLTPPGHMIHLGTCSFPHVGPLFPLATSFPIGARVSFRPGWGPPVHALREPCSLHTDYLLPIPPQSVMTTSFVGDFSTSLSLTRPCTALCRLRSSDRVSWLTTVFPGPGTLPHTQ